MYVYKTHVVYPVRTQRVYPRLLYVHTRFIVNLANTIQPAELFLSVDISVRALKYCGWNTRLSQNAFRVAAPVTERNNEKAIKCTERECNYQAQWPFAPGELSAAFMGCSLRVLVGTGIKKKKYAGYKENALMLILLEE